MSIPRTPAKGGRPDLMAPPTPMKPPPEKYLNEHNLNMTIPQMMEMQAMNQDLLLLHDRYLLEIEKHNNISRELKSVESQIQESVNWDHAMPATKDKVIQLEKRCEYLKTTLTEGISQRREIRSRYEDCQKEILRREATLEKENPTNTC